jgi:pyridoxal 5'-phosphate synthase pdxT subunit
MKIGVLALQGAFIEHIQVLQAMGVDTIPIRLPQELAACDGLIIPGGESTTISRLMRIYELDKPIKNMALGGFPVWGTCAGLILMSRSLTDADAIPLKLMDIAVRRNGFGRQKDSFDARLTIDVLGAKPFPGVFIRAPVIDRVGPTVKILSRLPDGTVTAVRQDKLLACAFHPELTRDARFHHYFMDIITGKQ